MKNLYSNLYVAIPLTLILILVAWVGLNRLRYKHIMSPKEAKAIQVDYFTGEIRHFSKDGETTLGNIFFKGETN